jgi:hypothetical protein
LTILGSADAGRARRGGFTDARSACSDRGVVAAGDPNKPLQDAMIGTPVATHTEHGTRCAVCRRNLLVGEAARTFQDPRSKGLQTVCPLCTGRATRQGWQLVGEREARRPLPVNGNNEVDHERLVRRLQIELERVESSLGGTTQQLNSEREIHATLQARIDELTSNLDQVRADTVELRRQVATHEAQLADAQRRVSEAHDAQEMLLRARRREADAAYLSAIGVEVFNRSVERATVAAAVGVYGDPHVRVGVDGIGLPRVVRVTFGWADASRSFRVTCDLVARLFDVEDLAHGGGMQPPLPAFSSNAQFVDGELALTSKPPATRYA